MTGNDADDAALAEPDTRLCCPLEVLGSLPHDVLAAMDKCLLGEPACMAVNLVALASAGGSDLAPASRWVKQTVVGTDEAPRLCLSVDAIAPLAELCHMTLATLTDLLRTVASGRR